MNRLLAIAVTATLANVANASNQPPVRITVEVKKAGTIVECPSVDGVMGQEVRVPLSIGRTVVAVARPMDADGRSKITVRFETPPVSGGKLTSAHELTNTFNLAQSSPSFQYGGRRRAHFVYGARHEFSTSRHNPSRARLAQAPS